MTEQRYFTDVEVAESVIEVLDGYTGCYSELQDEAFNQSYYIIGTSKAEDALKEYGTFEAIGAIVEYEKANFGEVSTDLSNPESVANMLWYIIGYDFLFETFDLYGVLLSIENDMEDSYELWNSRAIDEVNKIIIDKLKEWVIDND